MKTRQPTNLCIDIGNHQFTYGIYQSGRRIRSGSVKNDVFPKIYKNLIKSGGNNLKNIVISSVVPKITTNIKSTTPKNGSFRLTFVSSRSLKAIKTKYLGPTRLGMDRLINLYGMFKKYGGGLVIDCGTAITLDWVSSRGVFKGGLILPGFETALDNLHEKTTALPRISLDGPSPFPGRSTVTCIRGGVLKGYGHMVEGLVSSFRKRFKSPSAKVVITGGDGKRLKPHLKGVKNCIFDPYFTLESLNQYAEIQN